MENVNPDKRAAAIETVVSLQDIQHNAVILGELAQLEAKDGRLDNAIIIGQCAINISNCINHILNLVETFAMKQPVEVDITQIPMSKTVN